ncbi:MAG: tRNA pseudouridine synthase C [Spirochaetes bacterium ADurb.Bin110]|nr:MAG: tRNA pseudouridine synthase C [Spirochaetes bacterium ADurb.Bin110]
MIRILFENHEFIVIDKPAGLAAQPGEGLRDDVISALERQLGYRLFPVHRLDKETAGCMMLAKDAKAANEWSNRLASREITKRYQAWVAGVPSKRKGTIEDALEGKRGTQAACTLWTLHETWLFPLQEHFDSHFDAQDKEHVCNEIELANQYPAHVRVDAAEANSLTLSLLGLELSTGRMHQIRRHLAGIGLPILGDDKYGNFSLNKALRKKGIRHLMLWAYELVLPWPSLQPPNMTILATEPPHFISLRGILEREGRVLDRNIIGLGDEKTI